MTTNGLEKLDTWLKSREFANEIYYKILPLLPAEEKFNLNSQMRRAAVSVPANIAEGYGRYYYQTNIQFCYIARGSLEELLSHLILAHDFGFINDEKFSQTSLKGNGLVLLINGYISYLKRAKHGENEPGFSGVIHEEKPIYDTNEKP